MSKFSNLNLDLDDIDNIIKKKAKIIKKDNNISRSTFNLSSCCSTKNCILIIHHKKDGTSSLQVQGKDTSFGEEHECAGIFFKPVFRACLKIEELPDFSQTAGVYKAKNTGILSDSEAF